ncbi:SRPBCC family protein [Acinetobacter sp. WZC-1]|uniref:SRPBCC family protein n=1 Tax=Acinetobacter sp. WZC-1 TaxID=3459034 RepID=UPI00403E2678
MKNLNYEIVIEATPQKVWEILWTPESYSTWTQFFTPDSTMQSDWKVNGRTLFLDASGDGMVSTITRLEPFKVVIFKHLGTLQGGVEDLDSEDVKKWSGSLEKYMLDDLQGKTRLRAELQTDEAFQDMMDKGFHQGFELVRQMAEGQ